MPGPKYDMKFVREFLSKNDNEGYAMLEYLLPKLDAITDWSAQALRSFFRGVCAERSLLFGKVAQPVRVAVTGGMISPAIEDTLLLLGKEETITRIRLACLYHLPRGRNLSLGEYISCALCGYAISLGRLPRSADGSVIPPKECPCCGGSELPSGWFENGRIFFIETGMRPDNPDTEGSDARGD